MSDSCSGCSSAENCSSCGSAGGCGGEQSRYAPLNQMSDVKNVIAVVSGKGGVGKSLVTSLMSVIMQRRGNHTAVLDADITGPSIPKTCIQVMSINLLLEDNTDPVLWRGPVIAGTVTQFWSDVLWTDVDYMFVDMPPGTGDVPLTVFQSLPVKGIIVVASPQDLVGLIVEKAVKMAEMMKIPVLGIVENMSYFKCPDCGAEHKIFGESHVDEIAQKYDIPNVAKIPVDPKLAAAVDAGMIELFEGDWLDHLADYIENMK